MKTGTITPKVQYQVPLYKPVQPLQEAVDLIQPEVLESFLEPDERLVIKEHALRRDSITLLKAKVREESDSEQEPLLEKSDLETGKPARLDTMDTVETTYRRGSKWKLVNKETPMPMCKNLPLPGKKKLVIIPAESLFGMLHKAVESLEKLKIR